jgi:drug/metabolite transporter (DMT)-like permease
MVIQRHREGITEALLAALLFGLSAPVGKKLLGSISPQLLAGMLYLGSGIGLGAFWLIGRRRVERAEASLRRSDLPVLAIAIGVGGVLAPVFLLAGLQRTPASTASLLLNFETVFTALLAWTAFREHVNARIALGMISIVCGGLILSSTGTAQLTGWVGPVSVMAACLCWGIDNNVTQKISANDPTQIAAMKGLVAGTVNSVIALLLGNSWPSWDVLSGALLLGVLSYGVSLVLYIRALRKLGTSRTANYFSLAPFIGAVVSVLLWREPVTLPLLAAGGFMGAGLWLHLTEHHAHPHTHETIDHEHTHVHDEHHQHEHGPNDPSGEPHSHPHHHDTLTHSHEHYPDIHHRHHHDGDKE